MHWHSTQLSYEFGTNFTTTLFMAKSSIRMECAEKVLMSTSSGISRIVTRQSRITTAFTLAMIWSFQLVEGWPESGSLSTDVQPSLNRLYAHSIATESSLDLPNGFHLAVAQFLAKFDAVAVPVILSFSLQ